MRRWLVALLVMMGCKSTPAPVVPVEDVECPIGSVREGLRCVWAEVTCPQRTAWDGQHCVYDAAAVCPAGTRLEQGACHAEVIEDCPGGTQFEAGQGCVAAAAEAPRRPAHTKPKPSGQDVECILDPSRCPKTKKKPSGAKTKLTSAEIKQGIERVKADARACGPRHGAAPGTKVTVKIVVAGATGRVRRIVHRDQAGTALGACVGDALGRATFPTFDGDQTVFSYRVRM